jgi:hypothetical protein
VSFELLSVEQSASRKASADSSLRESCITQAKPRQLYRCVGHQCSGVAYLDCNADVAIYESSFRIPDSGIWMPPLQIRPN